MGNPFRPGAIVEPEYFVGRTEEINRFKQYLKNTKEGNPHHLAILGERGIGKTSLLRYLDYSAKKEKCMIVRIELDPSTESIEDLIVKILAEIKRSGMSYSLADKGVADLRDFFDKYKISLNISIAKVEPKKESATETKVEFRYKLQEIWDRLNGKVPAVVIMIDEAEQLEEIKGSLQYLRNVFLRISESHCGYLLVMSGKIGLFKQVKELHSPLARFFTPLTLAPLKNEEAKEALSRPLNENGIILDEKALQKMITDSECHPYVLQVIGYVIFENGKKTITQNDYTVLRPVFMKHLADQLFSDMFEGSSEEEQRLLQSMAQANKELTLKEIAQVMKKPSTSIGSPISRLIERNCIRRVGRGRYRLFHALFGEYVLVEFKQNSV